MRPRDKKRTDRAKILWIRPTPGPWLAPLWHDYLGFLLVVMAQTIVLPALSPSWLSWDLATPWMVFILIERTSWRALIHLFVACLFLEGLSVVPAGLYLCAMGVLAGLIQLFKAHISWRRPVSWLAMTTLAHLLLVSLLLVYQHTKTSSWAFVTPYYVFSHVFAWLSSCFFAWVFMQKLSLVRLELLDELNQAGESQG